MRLQGHLLSFHTFVFLARIGRETLRGLAAGSGRGRLVYGAARIRLRVHLARHMHLPQATLFQNPDDLQA